MKSLNTILLLLMCFTTLAANDPHDSGGYLLAEQAAYDVTFYDISITVFPDSQAIAGEVVVTAKVVSPTQWFVLDLDTVFIIESVRILQPESNRILFFENIEGKVWIRLGNVIPSGENIRVLVAYSGKPRIAPNPPWNGGFTWEKTDDGQHWIGVSCQGEGADIWWPCKDHPSDEPDSVALHITAPAELTTAASGRFQREEKKENGWTTTHWFVSTPINNYGVNIAIGPFNLISDAYTSITGENIPVSFYILPEFEERGRAQLPEFYDHLRFLESYLGPFPFKNDKYGLVQTPFKGMEHQTLIAYGAEFRNDAMTRRDWGFDALHLHELAHEWWGNMVSCSDWKDFWLQEGFATYMEPLYAEKLGGKENYHRYMNSQRHWIQNKQAVAPRFPKSESQVYGLEVYRKGAWILHGLRYLLGDEKFFRVLRRMSYADPAQEKLRDGRHCRLVTSDDFKQLVNSVSGKNYDWYFDVYLHQPALPRLITERTGDRVSIRWEVPEDLPFPMPVELKIGDTIKQVSMNNKSATLNVPRDQVMITDPNDWILKAAEIMEAKDDIPAGWRKRGRAADEYQIVIDKKNPYSGAACVMIRSLADAHTGRVSFSQLVSADELQGKRVRMKAYIRSEDLGWASLWFRVFAAERKPLDIVTMYDAPITGDSEWQCVELELDIPEESVEIDFGVFTGGNGRLWLDKFDFEEILRGDKPGEASEPKPITSADWENLDFED